MTPERKHKIRGRLVEEFYWCGRYPCYVDHRLCAEDFDATVARMKRGGDPVFKQVQHANEIDSAKSA